MEQDKGASADADRAVVNGAASVSAVPASIPSALALIEWEDSVQPSAAWEMLEDYEPSATVLIRSVGWLIADGDVKALAPNLGGVAGCGPQISGVIHIPARCVIRITKLSENQNGREQAPQAQVEASSESSPSLGQGGGATALEDRGADRLDTQQENQAHAGKGCDGATGLAPDAHTQMLLRAIISQHTNSGFTDAFRVACSAFRLGTAQAIEARQRQDAKTGQ